jgi:hypothetical protein
MRSRLRRAVSAVSASSSAGASICTPASCACFSRSQLHTPLRATWRSALLGRLTGLQAEVRPRQDQRSSHLGPAQDLSTDGRLRFHGWRSASMLSADFSALDRPVLALLPGVFRGCFATNGGCVHAVVALHVVMINRLMITRGVPAAARTGNFGYPESAQHSAVGDGASCDAKLSASRRRDLQRSGEQVNDRLDTGTRRSADGGQVNGRSDLRLGPIPVGGARNR